MSRLASPTLQFTHAQYETIVAHCFDGFPDEACGLIAGPVVGTGADAVPTGEVTGVYPCENAAHSALRYEIGGRDWMRAERDYEARGDGLVAVWHSHTHTDAYPSDTDVRQAMEPNWIYVIVSLKQAEPILRAYRIRDGRTEEVDIDVAGLA